MTNEVRLAFAHPSERAAATAGGDPLDRISLRDHIVEVEIGAFQAERGTTQRICFNVVVEVQPYSGPLEDDVDRILSYDSITEAIAHELAAERLNLLETLAYRIAERVLLEPQAVRVFVRVEKLDRGPGALGVEIVRSRSQAPLRKATDEGTEETLHPRVVYLSNATILSPDLTQWLDRFSSEGSPVILCVGPANMLAPQSSSPAVQRRIDLLSIEQNAWVLAGLDPRCVVVSTRTELEWAIRNGQMSVWAPSKIVLDAVDGPSANTRDAGALVVWFADYVHAERLLVVDAEVPQTTHVPVEYLTR